MSEFKTFLEEQHRQGQRAVDHDPNTRVVSAALYNSVVDKYNELLEQYVELSWILDGLRK